MLEVKVENNILSSIDMRIAYVCVLSLWCVQPQRCGEAGHARTLRVRFSFKDFSGSSHTRDLEIGAPVVTLPGAWHQWVSTGTGWPGVSIL